MKFEDTIRAIMTNIRLHTQDKALVVTSAGNISHYIYANFHSRGNFYNFGCYGATVPFALGLALNTQKKVYAIVGDGDALASLSTFALINKLHPLNLTVFVLDNNKFQTTGGQPTASDGIKFDQFYGTWRYEVDAPAPFEKYPIHYERIKEDFYEAVNSV